jgi:arylsulfatase A-like enzyme
MSDGKTDQNIVFVVMDTVKKDHLSVYGHDRQTTPELERFAEEARVFEQAVAPAPWTLPVHASLFTGQYPSQHGTTQERPYLNETVTLAETLSELGYTNACYTSNTWITPYTKLTRGFDDQDNFFEALPSDVLFGPMARVWKEMNDHEMLRTAANWLVSAGNTLHEHFASTQQADSKTPAVIDQTIEFIDQADGPYFTFLNLMDAHLPYHPPDEYRQEFAPSVDSTEVCQNSKEYNSGARSIGSEEWTDIKNLYDAEIRHIDAELTRLFDWLRAADEWEDTLIIVCADHGELHGEHDLYGHEFGLYDPIINVPLLVKHPELDPGREEQQVELLDLYHTVLDHAGATPEDSTALGNDAVPISPVRSLLSADYRTPSDEDETDALIGNGTSAFVEYSRPVIELHQLESKAQSANITLDEDSRFYSRMRAVRQSDGKYIRNERIPDEAYQLDDDPEEHTNLGDNDALDHLEAILSEFESRVAQDWSASSPEQSGEEALEGMSDQAKERLQHLGYRE